MIVLGIFIGVIIGIVIMCIFQINRVKTYKCQYELLEKEIDKAYCLLHKSDKK